MKAITNEAKENVNRILDSEKLFRYDCEFPEESEVSKVELEFARSTGFKYSVGMNSCSSAIFISLLCAGVKSGDTVMIPAFTFIAVPSSVIHAGANVVYSDVDENYVLDIKKLEESFKKHQPGFLLISHMRGRISDMDVVTEICKKNEVVLIEDCAHSLGVLWKGTQTGHHGVAASFSAQSYKMVDGGEGGFFCTNSEEMAVKAMLYAGCYETNWKKHFLEPDGQKLAKELVNQLPAYNFRMSNLTAGVLRPQLETIENRVERFNKNYEDFIQIVSQSSKIRVPKFLDNVRFAADSAQFQILTGEEEKLSKLRDALKEENDIKLNIFGIDKNNARCFWRWKFADQADHECDYTKGLLFNTADIRLRLYLETEDVRKLAEKIVSKVNKII